ncbi:MAG TPA: hypothetical protein VHI13_06050 [Candidatus Kapabacteria bacterium]|nr:hypothetical protein [Candidatus Kapabacteria bacterium]
MMHHLTVRSASIVAALAALILFGLPHNMAAQNYNCLCDHITINVDLAVACKVTFCVLPPNGAKNCVTIAPGTRGSAPCISGAVLGFRDCHGNLVTYDPTIPCQLGIGVGPNCCTIDACASTDVNGCLVINVRPSILDVCPCL